MIDLSVSELYILDLQDDVTVNTDKKFYDFIDKDITKAFYLGCNLSKWFDKLDKNQQYLYSKDARHVTDFVDTAQVSYWLKKYPVPSDQEVPLDEICSYVLNNMIYDPKTEEKSMIATAFMLGNTLSNKNEEA